MSSPLSGWDTFYEIAGSAAAALTGLQFVAITLIAQTRAKASMREIHAFGTPTVVSFCVALLLAAIMTAPWGDLSKLGFCLGGVGVVGLVYSLRAIRHAQQADYNPDVEDWIWYSAMPMLGHAALITAAVLFWFRPEWSVVIIAGTDFLFLFVGIHNSWDTVTYLTTRNSNKPE